MCRWVSEWVSECVEVSHEGMEVVSARANGVVVMVASEVVVVMVASEVVVVVASEGRDIVTRRVASLRCAIGHVPCSRNRNNKIVLDARGVEWDWQMHSLHACKHVSAPRKFSNRNAQRNVCRHKTASHLRTELTADCAADTATETRQITTANNSMCVMLKRNLGSVVVEESATRRPCLVGP